MQAYCVRCAVVGLAGIGLFVSSAYFGGDAKTTPSSKEALPPVAAASAVLSLAGPEDRLRIDAPKR